MESTEVVADATPQEVQWCKGWSVRRALRHKGAGIATREDLYLIEEKTDRVVSTSDYLAVTSKEIAANRQNMTKYFG